MPPQFVGQELPVIINCAHKANQKPNTTLDLQETALQTFQLY